MANTPLGVPCNDRSSAHIRTISSLPGLDLGRDECGRGASLTPGLGHHHPCDRFVDSGDRAFPVKLPRCTAGALVTLLWTILTATALILLSSWDELLMMAVDAIQFRRGDDKPARRRRLAKPSNPPSPDGERASQRLSLFRRSRPTDSNAAAGDGNPPHSSVPAWAISGAGQRRSKAARNWTRIDRVPRESCYHRAVARGI